MGVLALEFSELNSSFEGLKFVWWWGTSPMKMVKKEIGFGTTWAGILDIDCAF